MAFRTQLDFSNNRQVKQRIETIQVLSGATSFGVPFSALTVGPDPTTSGISQSYSAVLSTFSGNSGTTNYTWYNGDMIIAQSVLSALTPSNSGITQNTGNIFVGNTTTVIDGNSINTSYSGVSFDLTVLDMFVLGGGNYSGSVTTVTLDILSAGTLDFTGRTIWADVSGITRTQDLIITDNPIIGYAWVCTTPEGKGAWTNVGSGGGGNDAYWVSGITGTHSIINVGNGGTSTNFYSYAEGYLTSSVANYGHAEGFETTASGVVAHAEGTETISSGNSSHAEGIQTTAGGNYSHAEGSKTTALNDESHAEGYMTTALEGSHAEGTYSLASGNFSHAEGSATQAIGLYSHAEGSGSIAFDNYSHAEGSNTFASGTSAHAEGSGTTAIGVGSHAEGYQATASGNTSHAEGYSTWSVGYASHSEGYNTQANGLYGSHAEGSNTTASGTSSHSEGSGTTASGSSSHAEGYFTSALNNYTHTEGQQTTASGQSSHAEGYYTTAGGLYSHAEGNGTYTIGNYSHTEGFDTTALYVGHAEGWNTTASGTSSHAEGIDTIAAGNYSHAEGNVTTAIGLYSHAGGAYSVASGNTSFVHSANSLALGDYSAVIGGQYITGSTSNTVYVPNLIIYTGTSFNSVLGINTPNPQHTIDIFGPDGRFYTILAGETYINASISGSTYGLTQVGAGSDGTGIGMGISGINNVTYPDYGNPNDVFIYAGQNTTGLNIIKGNSSGSNPDYIKFFAGVNGDAAPGNVPAMYIQGSGSSISGNIGYIAIGNMSPTQQLDVTLNGRFRTIGSSASAGALHYAADGTLTTNTSDYRLKTNVETLTSALEKVIALRGVYYNWTADTSGVTRVGFIAQEVNAVIPELTFVNPNSPEQYMGVHYDNVTALLVEAIKELYSGLTTSGNTYLETQTILAEDNDIQLNFSGNNQTSIGGGIKVLHAISGDTAAELITDTNGNWTTNNDFRPSALTVPNYTPTSSSDTNGNDGNITSDETYLYIKRNGSWKRINLENF